MAAALPLVRLKTRPQFLKIAGRGAKYVRPTLIVQALILDEGDRSYAKRLARVPHLDAAIYVGFTASKKVGNAVARNRAKRRLTALTHEILPDLASANWGFVIIARNTAVAAPVADLRADLHKAIAHLMKFSNHKARRGPSNGRSQQLRRLNPQKKSKGFGS